MNASRLRLEYYSSTLNILIISLVDAIFSDLLRSIVFTIVSARNPLFFTFPYLVRAYAFSVPRLLNVYYLGIFPLLVIIASYFIEASLEESNVVELGVNNKAPLNRCSSHILYS